MTAMPPPADLARCIASSAETDEDRAVSDDVVLPGNADTCADLQAKQAGIAQGFENPLSDLIGFGFDDVW